MRLADGGVGTQIAAELTDLPQLGILYVTGNVAAVSSNDVHVHASLAKPYRPGDLLRSLQLVAELTDTGTATPPFPPNFHVLAAAGVADGADSDDHAARAQTLRWQQSVLADLGNDVRRQSELAAVLTEAVRACAAGLRTLYCDVHRYRPAQEDLLREAAFGCHSGVPELVVLRADMQTSEGRAFVTRAPVICNAPHAPNGFSRPESQATRRTLSSVHVIIKGEHGRPYGVLGASTDTGQGYDQDDVDFLSRVADIVAASVAGVEHTAILNRTIEGWPVKTVPTRRVLDQQPVIDQRLGAGFTHGVSSAFGKAGERTNVPATNTRMRLAGPPSAPAPLAADGTPGDPHLSGEAYVANHSVLIIEDDALLRDELAEQFAVQPRFRVFTAGTLEQADRILLAMGHHFDTIMLDIGLPDGDGCDYCRGLRRQGHEMPIIMLTGRNDEVDVVRGLDAGAHDYVVKPFTWSELFARVRAHLRLYEDSEGAAFTIGPYVFRPARKLCRT